MSRAATRAGGAAQLAAIANRIRELGLLPRKIAPRAAELIEEDIAANVAAGRGPSGEAWEPKADGSKPLVGAASAVVAAASGSKVIVTLTAPEAFHHKGRTRGRKVRAILPSAVNPEPIVKAVRRAISEELR